MHRNRDQTPGLPVWLHLEKKPVQTSGIEGQILTPVQKLHTIDGKTDSLLIEKNCSALRKDMPACLTVCAQFFFVTKERLAAAHTERFLYIGKRFLTFAADQVFLGKQNPIADRTAGRIEQIQKLRSHTDQARAQDGKEDRGIRF
jgi:hypothetical protein